MTKLESVGKSIPLTDGQQAQVHCHNLAAYLQKAWIMSGKPLDPEGLVKHVRILIAGALERSFEILRGK